MKITIIFERFVFFDVETFEFSVRPKLIFIFFSIEYGVSFYWGQARVNFDSSLFWIHIQNWVTKTTSISWKSNVIFNALHPLIRLYLLSTGIAGSPFNLHLNLAK